MKKIQICFVVLLVFLLAESFIFAAGQQENTNDKSDSILNESQNNGPDWLVENTEDHITIIDSYKNQVTIKKPVKKIVADGMGSVFAALRSIDAEESIIAGNSYVKKNKVFFPEFSKLPIFSVGPQAIDNEMLIQLNPDFIITSPFLLPQLSDAVRSEIPLVQLSFYSFEAYSILGALLDKEAEANEFIEWIKSYTDIIDQRISDLPKEEYQPVFIYYGGEYGMSAPPPYGTLGNKSNRNDIINRAGGRSITCNLEGDWITVDPEWVIEQNPPLIVRECYVYKANPELGYDVSDNSNAKLLMNSILNEQPAFKNCDAVKNGKVYLIYGDFIEDSWFISLVYLAKWFHPDLFSDLDPELMHQEYLTRFQKLDFDLTTQGLFTYSTSEGGK